MLSKPGNSTPTVGRQTTAKKRIGKSVTGLVLTLGLCPKFGPPMISSLIGTSGFLTELGDVFADPVFPPTKGRSATPSERGCFRRADAPATLVHKPTPNFAVGRGLIPRPLLPRCGSARHPALEIEVRVEPFTIGHGDSRCTHCEPERRARCRFCRDQRAVLLRCTGCPSPHPPLDDARSASQTARSSRASIGRMPQGRRASVCGSAAGRCAPAAMR